MTLIRGLVWLGERVGVGEDFCIYAARLNMLCGRRPHFFSFFLAAVKCPWGWRVERGQQGHG